jgi:integrase
MNQRANGEGSIYRRADGRWTAACYVLRPDGTRVRRSVYGKTRKDVADQLAVLIAKTKAGLPLAVESWSLERFADHWLKHVVGSRLRPSTLSSYRETLRLHIIPTLGRTNLRALTPTHVRTLLANKAADGLGARSIQIIHSTLRTMLNEAMREELIERNVATVVRPPVIERVEVQPWSTEEASRFLSASADHRLHALFAVGVALGLRKGELLALRWDDVDLEGGVLHIRQTCSGCPRWALCSDLQSPTSRVAQFRFLQPRRKCSEPTAQIRLPKPLRSDRPGSTPAWSLPRPSAR